MLCFEAISARLVAGVPYGWYHRQVHCNLEVFYHLICYNNQKLLCEYVPNNVQLPSAINQSIGKDEHWLIKRGSISAIPDLVDLNAFFFL